MSCTSNDLIIGCGTLGCDVVVAHVVATLGSWNWWSLASKSFACFLGAAIAALGILVASKKLPDTWHYGLSALLAGAAFVAGMLQPYEEYKQFSRLRKNWLAIHSSSP